MLVGLLAVIGATAIVCLRARLFPLWFTAARTAQALISVARPCTIGYTAGGIQVAAGLANILDYPWILMLNIYFWRDPALTVP